MKEKFELGPQNSYKDSDTLLFSKVRWTENGITHLGTVTEIYSINGIKYLTVMTIFGKRRTVKMSKVKIQTEYLRA